jgi:hypothetical protein
MWHSIFLVIFSFCLVIFTIIFCFSFGTSSLTDLEESLRENQTNTQIQMEIDTLEALLPMSDSPILNINTKWRDSIRSHHNIFLKEYEAFTSKFTVAPHKSSVGVYASTIDKYDKWNSIVLRLFGNDTKFANMFPNTMRILNSAGQPFPSIIFSTLSPGAELEPHRGVTKAVLRYHLGLRVPKAFENCHISLWDENGKEFKHSWEAGKDVVFDDTFEHGVQNRTKESRTVLFLDVQREYNDTKHQETRDRLLQIGNKLVHYNELKRINALWARTLRVRHLSRFSRLRKKNQSWRRNYLK